MKHDLRRRHYLVNSLPVGLTALTFTSLIKAQKQINSARIINGFPPGGAVDIVCRKLAERTIGAWASNIIVENKTGAGGRLAVDALKAAVADGTTMLVTPSSVLTMYPHIYKQLSYDVFADLAPVSIVAVTEFALAVGPAVPASVETFEQFAAWCRLNRTAAQCGNPGAGSLPHFIAMLMAREANIDFVHVPYRGGMAAMQEVAAGQVSAALATEGSAQVLERAGRIRVLATTGSDRSAFLSKVPTFREMGFPNLVQREWFGAFMSSKSSPAAVTLAANAIRVALQEPELRGVWQRAALSVESSSPTELRSVHRAEYEFWGPIIKASGFTPEA
jgi:tripartite-type tricarboxylate transporter receptor subunit TctC